VLKKKTRIRLALAVADRLGDLTTYDETNLILSTYGLETLDRSFDGPSLHDIVATATDDQLVELAEYFELDLPELPAPESHVATVSSARPLFLFGSHLTEHRVLVGDVSRALRDYGIDLFVAHDSIDHDDLWQEEIEKALDRADAGLVFLHQGLKESPWCDQEIGWLQGRHVPVMALNFDLMPYGFFAKHQAQKVHAGATPTAIAEMVADRIAKRPELAQGFAASLVSAMKLSNSFAQTEAIWERLRKLKSLDANLCSQLLDATKNNTQIYWAIDKAHTRKPFKSLIIEFVRQQPGGAVIESDINAYATYLDGEDAEAKARHDAIRERMRASMRKPPES
jgi:hypothetical protein